MKNKNRCGIKKSWLYAAGVFAIYANASTIDYAGGKLKINGALTYGAAERTQNRDPALLYSRDAAAIGIDGASPFGRNQDDGNLNYGRGEYISKVLKGWLILDYTRGDYGAEFSAKGWYDFVQAKDNVPQGNSSNGYQANTPLSDQGASPRSKFNGLVANDANVFGRNAIARIPLSWKLGLQKIDWGQQFYTFGGLRDLMPVDLPAEMRPGVQRDMETRISIPALFVHADLTTETAAEGFAQLAFTPNALNQCGTFYSQIDFLAEGCRVITLAMTDREDIKDGPMIQRAATVDPSNSRQFGFALKHKIESVQTELGLYGAQFHSRSTYYAAIKSGRISGPQLIVGDPGGLNPKYFTEYPEDIRMLAITADKKLRNGALFSEIAYRPNQPYQYNATDLFNGVLSPTAPTPLRTKIDAIAPGATVHGYERHQSLQLQLGGNLSFPDVLGASAMLLGTQMVFHLVPDLPDFNTARFRRGDAFGQGPVSGLCTGSSVQCTNEGYVSRNAFGYRLQAGLRYLNLTPGLDFIPSIFYGQDVSGWTEDGSINKGRQFAVLSLKAIAHKMFTAELAWKPTWGGSYNLLRDRSTLEGTVGLQF